MPRSSAQFYNTRSTSQSFSKGKIDFSTKESNPKVEQTSAIIKLLMGTKKMSDDIIDRMLCKIQSKSYKGETLLLSKVEEDMIEEFRVSYNAKKDNDPDTELSNLLKGNIIKKFNEALKDRTKTPYKVVIKKDAKHQDHIYFLSLTGERIG